MTFALPRPQSLALLLLLVSLAGGCSMPSLLITPVSSSPVLEESIVADGSRRHKIALIEVEGMIVNARVGGGFLGAQENKVSLLKQQFDAAAADRSVKAVVLRINSPGGTVPASDLVYEMVRDFKQRTGKPVLAACQDVTASGGYYIACAADEIHALPTSVVGSIGVIFETFDISQLLNKIGVHVTPIKSAALKDMGTPFDGLNEAEREVLQGMINEFYERFKEVVREARPVSDESVAFDGRVFTGNQALEMGLVDRVCQLPESLRRAREMIGRKDARIVMYRRPYGYRGSIYAGSQDLEPQAGAAPGAASWVAQMPIVNEMSQVLRPGFYYLWMP